MDTPLFNANYIEGLYEAFRRDPAVVNAEWRAYFRDLDRSPQDAGAVSENGDGGSCLTTAASISPARANRQMAVLQLIDSFRTRGHREADLDPLYLCERPKVPDLDPAWHGLSATDWDAEFCIAVLPGPAQRSLRELVAHLRKLYCGTLGAEFMHITDTAQKEWLRERLESPRPALDTNTRIGLLESLTAAEGLEHFLEQQYVGQKRFSLEGGETLIPMLDALIQRAGAGGTREIVFGMAHRGRLNVLVNVLGKPTRELFNEFEGVFPEVMNSGDVKYHQGYSSDVVTPGGEVHLVLAFNPSHLEIINPVVEGSVRARQQLRGDRQRDQVLPVLIHGDAAFAGQGVVMETFNLSQTQGFRTGGTVHVIINNQIGFTTSDPLDSRSTLYCTDVAKMVQAPILHVNGDDPEAALFAMELALDFRMEFHRDVVVDLVCYRRKGHNEADEPQVTQPLMYHKIAAHPTPVERYARQLIDEQVIQPEEPQILAQRYRAALKTREIVTRPKIRGAEERQDWGRYQGKKWTEEVATHLSPAELVDLATRMTTVPEDFPLHRAVAKVLAARREMGAGGQRADWGFAETLAYASLLRAGYPVRLSGQDSGRGTFAHRHAVLLNQDSGETYLPLQHLDPDQAPFLVINSLLSEEAVLGFEFGYATSDPEGLTLWEAQFGDFTNGAQVVIDQFLVSSETKWKRLCGLVLLLPHGYDGQGPEHSSARPERFLQLCAEDNIQVCVPSTPAQYFHLLRRQMLRPYRKPLVVLTPKSLLRDKQATSPREDFTEGGFQTVIDDNLPREPVQRVLLCAGQVYYKLLNYREKQNIDNISIVRLEQLYPFPRKTLHELIKRYPNAKQWIWTQEEPANQGAWRFIKPRMPKSWGIDLQYAGRLASASPAVGYMAVHRKQLDELLDQAFDLGFV